MPQAPSVGASQLSSSNLMSCLRRSMPMAVEAAEVLIDHVGGRRLQDYLKLLVLVQPVGIFAVAAVGGAAAGLHVSHAIGFGAENAEECFGRHGAGADLEIVGFLDDAAAVGPVLFEAEDGLLEGRGWGWGLGTEWRHNASRIGAYGGCAPRVVRSGDLGGGAGRGLFPWSRIEALVAGWG